MVFLHFKMKCEKERRKKKNNRQRGQRCTEMQINQNGKSQRGTTLLARQWQKQPLYQKSRELKRQGKLGFQINTKKRQA